MLFATAAASYVGPDAVLVRRVKGTDPPGLAYLELFRYSVRQPLHPRDES